MNGSPSRMCKRGKKRSFAPGNVEDQDYVPMQDPPAVHAVNARDVNEDYDELDDEKRDIEAEEALEVLRQHQARKRKNRTTSGLVPTRRAEARRRWRERVIVFCIVVSVRFPESAPLSLVEKSGLSYDFAAFHLNHVIHDLLHVPHFWRTVLPASREDGWTDLSASVATGSSTRQGRRDNDETRAMPAWSTARSTRLSFEPWSL